ncbi:MAG: Mbeg1-like protein [Bacilli bacterium]
MGDIFDYIYWRGDLDFNQVLFNEVDNLIFSRLSYLPFENIINNNERLTIEECFQKSLNFKEDMFLCKNDFKLFKVLAESKRFGGLCLSNFIHEIDYKLEQQFAALSIDLPGDCLYVAFRGTDDSFVGWKEDFNMIFLDTIPGQKKALLYLNNIEVNDNTKVIVGGHSKGGNLAIYASVNAKKEIKNKIISVYNNDGPGFLEDTMDDENYKEIEKKIHSFIPQTSIIGRLLNNNDNYLVVNSSEKFILQHDLYSWKIERDDLVYLEEIDDNSRRINKIVSEWLSKISLEEREKFVNILYNVLISSNIRTFREIDTKWYIGAKNIIKKYRNISKEDKIVLDKVIDYLVASIKTNIFTKKSILKKR